MRTYLQRIDLLLCQALLVSLSILWYPIFSEDGVKAHHIIIIVLAAVATASGTLPSFLHAEVQRRPFFYFALLGWYLTLLVTTSAFDTAWTPVKVTSYSAQLLIGTYAAFRLVQTKGIAGLKRPLNISFVIFLITFFGLSGVPLSNIADSFVRSIATASPNIIIFDFLARAPLFQSFSEDGLDGLRHTVSMYLLLALLVNLMQIRKRTDIAISLALAILIVLLQSRSAWLAFIGPAIAFGIAKASRLRAGQWLLVLVTFPILAIGTVLTFGPVIWTRMTQSDSYSGRAERLDEALLYLRDFSFEPISMFREFSSPHMFVFDSYYSGGVVAFILACFICLYVAIQCLPKGRIVLQPAHLGFVFAVPLLIRLFTAGSGLPGMGATFGFSVALALNALPRKSPTRK